MAMTAGGCSSTYRGIDPGDVSPPFSRDTFHPDSVVHLDLSYENDGVDFNMDRSLRSLTSYWSSGYRDKYGGRYFETADYRTYATFRSLELSIAKLHELGVEDLSRDLAEEMVAKRKQEYANYIVFDVHVFIPEAYPDAYAKTSLGEPGNRITLEDEQGRVYQPETIEVHMPRRFHSNMMDTPGAFYRLNTVYFKREIDGRDILENIDRMELWMRTAQPYAGLFFTWNFEKEAVALAQ